VKHVLVFEMSAGQMVEDVRLSVEGRCPVSFYGRPGGVVATPEELARVITRTYHKIGLEVDEGTALTRTPNDQATNKEASR